jgi:hypothetical protein
MIIFYPVSKDNFLNKISLNLFDLFSVNTRHILNKRMFIAHDRRQPSVDMSKCSKQSFEQVFIDSGRQFKVRDVLTDGRNISAGSSSSRKSCGLASIQLIVIY